MNPEDLDDKDVWLLQLLRENPEAKASDLSMETGLPLSTVRRRLRRLTDEDHFRLAAAFPVEAVISVDVDQRLMAEKRFEGAKREAKGVVSRRYSSQEEFALWLETSFVSDIQKERPEVADVKVKLARVLLGGRSDIIVVVEARNARALADFVTRALAIQEGIKATNTAVVSLPKREELRKFNRDFGAGKITKK